MKQYKINPIVVDTWASEEEALHEYGVKLTRIEDVSEVDCVIVAVAHNEFKMLSFTEIKYLYKNIPDSGKEIINVKGLYKIDELEASGMLWLRL